MRKAIVYAMKRENIGLNFSVVALLVSISAGFLGYNSVGTVIIICTLVIIGQIWSVAAWLKEGCA